MEADENPDSWALESCFIKAFPMPGFDALSLLVAQTGLLEDNSNHVVLVLLVASTGPARDSCLPSLDGGKE